MVQDDLSKLHRLVRDQDKVVANAIMECKKDIQDHLVLLNASVSSHALMLLEEVGRRVTEINAVAKCVPGGIAISGGITFEDATGKKYQIHAYMMTSIKQFEAFMKAMFQDPRKKECIALQKFVDASAFELYTEMAGIIKEDADLLVLFQENEATLKMRVIVEQKKTWENDAQKLKNNNPHREILVTSEVDEGLGSKDEIEEGTLEMMKNMHIKQLSQANFAQADPDPPLWLQDDLMAKYPGDILELFCKRLDGG
ncbi:hypothetical protein BDN72DRAFT_850375 [Pluteus cervinus]|uniref:Uncharacterized protein n=1 Tax=Pluteus cervinus TaxID=181527 RepID=A0ACD3A5G1_9AGAR|nr:hypothetical protein BDN72DRAFT_850375 [Pluteus cervinus]